MRHILVALVLCLGAVYAQSPEGMYQIEKFHEFTSVDQNCQIFYNTRWIYTSTQRTINY